jgi:ferredoxin
MADIANRYPENVTGKFYVDNQCIDCDLCRETAPTCFTRNDDGGYSYVFKQPENEDEEKQCKEAMEGCPVEAIGNNGPSSGQFPTRSPREESRGLLLFPHRRPLGVD